MKTSVCFKLCYNHAIRITLLSLPQQIFPESINPYPEKRNNDLSDKVKVEHIISSVANQTNKLCLAN